jgi:2-polyprenyl-6-methoxyphenol hydroxylase-like FAD-dependent oxidoreductase
MDNALGHEAIVIGAGMGGLAAAKALSQHFEHVTVLDRDTLPSEPAPRIGTPQARQLHVLLLSGQQALAHLFPGFEKALEDSGALKLRGGRELRWERPGFDPFPMRDFGYETFYMSRALLEYTCRELLTATDNVSLLANSRVTQITASDTGVANGVRYEDAEGATTTLSADFIVDASGRGGPTLAFLAALGLPAPETTEIGVDVGYASALFEPPTPEPQGWRGVFHMPKAPESSRGAILFPLEGKRWLVGLGGRNDEQPPGDIDGFMSFLKGLRTSTIYDAVCKAKRVSEIYRFNAPENVRRHFERLPHFPQGLIAVADAVCRFNPLYGQGMSVAAMEARLLDQMLEQRKGTANPLGGLGLAFFEEIQALLATPWSVSESDFIFPQTRGVRPPDIDRRLQYGAALLKLAAEDPAVHKTMVEVNFLLKPGTALLEPHIASRVMELMQSPA